jgi:acetoacetyl-CoA synthetase
VTAEGEVLWEPSNETRERSNISKFMNWLESEKRLNFKNYQELNKWSITNISDFWESIYHYFEINPSANYDFVIDDENAVFGAKWFSGATLNYAERSFRNRDPAKTALIFRNEQGDLSAISWRELYKHTAAVSSALKEYGVGKGDRVGALIPNIPEAVVGLLACASIGAIWSSCSPDFGVPSIVDRFSQIKPRVLIGVDGIQYNGKKYGKLEVMRSLQTDLPSVQKTVLISENSDLDNSVRWQNLLDSGSKKLEFEPLPFNNPLWILYSSGTTGLPKPLVHSHGGILLEHFKALSLHQDLTPDDRFFWYTTTGWMMWNYLVSGLLIDSAVILYDGNPMYPHPDSLWRLAEETKMTTFGTSAAYISACVKAELSPKNSFGLESLKSVASTGSPLSVDSFVYLYEKVKRDLWVASVSGGTDVCTAFVGCCPLLPVTAGEIQCICLGADIRAYDQSGKPVINEMGELVIAKPMPSMPVFLWGDDGNKRYLESYFSTFAGVWRHGDWIKITDRGTCQIYGRSDSTIKRLGLRMGTSEIYRVVESLPGVRDSLAVDVGLPDGRSILILFVVLTPGRLLDQELLERIKRKISTDLSPRFVPDRILEVREIPKTLNGKKMEVPVKRVLMGVPRHKALSVDSMANPEAIEIYEGLREELFGIS